MKRLIVSKYIIPIIDNPVYDKALLIDDNIVIDIGSYKELKRRHTNIIVEDYSDFIIMPGFINAHTHLELSLKDKKLSGTSFVDWIYGVKQIKDKLSVDDYNRAVLYGIDRLWESGVSAVGDISSSPYSSHAQLSASKMQGRVYFEFLAPSPAVVEQNIKVLKQSINKANLCSMPHGISPHSSYTLCEDAFKVINEYINKNNYQSAVHVGESYLEKEFFKDRSGRLFEFINDFHPVSKDIKNTTPLAYLYSKGYLLDKALIIHLNVLSKGNEEIKLIKEKELSVVHCPRSHDYFNNPSFELKRLLDAKVNIAIGTDSLLSNYSLSFFDEMLFMKNKFPFLSYKEIIKMASLNGAKALALKDGFGKIEKNKPYFLIALYCPHSNMLSKEEDIFNYIANYKNAPAHINSKS